MAEKPSTIDDRHERDRLWWRHERDRLREELARVEARAERLAGVLRFYADRENWLDGIRPDGSRAFLDSGEYARAALADADKPDRVAECRHGTEGAVADPSICSVCVWDGLTTEEQDVLTRALRRGVRMVVEAEPPTCERTWQQERADVVAKLRALADLPGRSNVAMLVLDIFARAARAIAALIERGEHEGAAATTKCDETKG
jgi:hypothetical protein